MDALTERKKRSLINDCEVAKITYTWKNKTAVRQYDFIESQAKVATTIGRITLLEGVKTSLDYIMEGITR